MKRKYSLKAKQKPRKRLSNITQEQEFEDEDEDEENTSKKLLFNTPLSSQQHQPKSYQNDSIINEEDK